MNEIQQKVVITVIVIAAVVFHTFTLNTLVKMLALANRDLLQLLLILFLAEQALFVEIVVIGGMAQVYWQSQECFIQLKRDLTLEVKGNLKELKWKLKFYKSCSMVKVRFGSLNFIDRLTALRCMELSNELTMQVLLVAKR